MLDVILLIVLAAAAFKGWRSGFLSMLLGLVLLIVAGFVASSFAEPVGNMMGVTNAHLRPVLGFVTIFVVIVLFGSRVRRFIRPRRGLLRGMDGLLGAALGVLRGAFLVSILLILLRLVNVPKESVREGSILYPILLKTSTTVIHVLRPYTHIAEPEATVERIL
jgi:membrane protein required for colicin V production